MTTRLGAAEAAMARCAGKLVDKNCSRLGPGDQLQFTRELWNKHGYELSRGDPENSQQRSTIDVAITPSSSNSQASGVNEWLANTPDSVSSSATSLQGTGSAYR